LGQNQRFDYAAATVSLMRPGTAPAHARHVAERRTAQQSGLAVEIPCRQCGRPILMVAADGATEIADRTEFLRVHQTCLVASMPEQRSETLSRWRT